MCCLTGHAFPVLCPSGLLSRNGSSCQLTTGGHVPTPTTSNQIMWRPHLPLSVIPLDLLILRNKITSSVCSKQMIEVKETTCAGLCFVLFPATSRYHCWTFIISVYSVLLNFSLKRFTERVSFINMTASWSESRVWRLLTSKRLKCFISLLHKLTEVCTLQKSDHQLVKAKDVTIMFLPLSASLC